MKILMCFLVIFVLLNIYACRKTPEHIRLLDKQVAIFVNKVKQEENFVLFGSGGALMHDIKEINLSFYDFHNEMQVPNARKLLTKNVENFLQQINESNEIRPFLHNYPFTYKNLEFFISFQDRNFKDPAKGYLVSATLINGMIKYLSGDGNGNYNLFYKEPYEEGLQLTQNTINN